MFFLLDASPCNPLLFTFFDNLHGQIVLKVLLHWICVSPLVVCFLRFPNDPHNICNISSPVCIFGQRSLSLCIFENGRASVPNAFYLRMVNGDFLVCLVRQFEAVRGLE